MTAVGATATSNTVRRDVCFRPDAILASKADMGAKLPFVSRASASQLLAAGGRLAFEAVQNESSRDATHLERSGSGRFYRRERSDEYLSAASV